MIIVHNKFQNNNLEIVFSGDIIETKNILVPISNDVNFKPVIDFLIEVISNKVKLNSSFEDFTAQDNVEKLSLIKETIEEIYEEYNRSLDTMVDQEENKVESSVVSDLEVL